MSIGKEFFRILPVQKTDWIGLGQVPGSWMENRMDRWIDKGME